MQKNLFAIVFKTKRDVNGNARKVVVAYDTAAAQAHIDVVLMVTSAGAGQALAEHYGAERFTFGLSVAPDEVEVSPAEYKGLKALARKYELRDLGQALERTATKDGAK